MSIAIDRLVRNQLIFREVNERICEVAERYWGQGWGVLLDFMCECSRQDCTETIELELAEYKAIRSFPPLFVIVPGHETPRVETVFDLAKRYALIERVHRLELVTESYEPEPTDRLRSVP
jgi:hypothetical protein